MAEARGTVSIDDDRVRVTTWTFEAAGDATGQHRHERSPYLGTAGTDHDVVNATDGEAVFVEIELKR
jgi:hypothetical protein